MRLQNEFEAQTGEVWPLNVGQVYTTLQRLERDGLVETDAEGERSQKLALVADAELFRLEAIVRWLDAAASARGVPHSRGAAFCWQCGAELMPVGGA